MVAEACADAGRAGRSNAAGGSEGRRTTPSTSTVRMRRPWRRPTTNHTRSIASCGHRVDVERARGLAVLVFLQENSSLDCSNSQCNSCRSTGAKTIPGIGSLVTAASRAATGKKLETFMLATKEQTVAIDWLSEKQNKG